MGKNINAKTKYYYVIRKLNGETPTNLAIELGVKTKKPGELIGSWVRKYELFGFDGLISKTGKPKGKNRERPKKKPKPKYEDMSKE